MTKGRMTESMGQSVLVDNQPGAATMIGIEAVGRAPADGYTLLFGSTSFGLNLVTRKNVRYKLEDFAPVSQVIATPYAISMSPTVPAKTLKEFIVYAKANPSKVNYGTLGVGGSQHLLGEILNRVAGLQMAPIPYSGSAPVLAALFSGEVQIYFDVLFTSVPYHREKKLVLLAATTKDRVDIAPDIPTAAELGFPDLVVSAWLGFIAKAGTPKPIIQQLNQEIIRAVANPAVQRRIIDSGNIPITGSPEAFDEVIRADMDRWGRVAKALKIELE
jgi:tripartite-type tricarboxylate transporter receptor subunit TctC